MIGALINLTLLGVIGRYLIFEGIMRVFEPVEIIGWLMAVAALLALVVELATVVLLWTMSRGSLNVRAALVHNIVDALGSLAVLVGAGAIIWLAWMWIDSALTLLVAGYVLWQVARMLPQAIKVLMEGAPADLELQEVIKRVESLEGVEGLHHLHVWELDEHHRAMEARIVIARERTDGLESIKHRLKDYLSAECDIHHSTLEFEFDDQPPDENHDTSIVAKH